jgi:hypothetical protein
VSDDQVMTDPIKRTHKHSLRLRQEMERWLDQTREMDPPGQGGGEDEANYALAWFPHYLVTGSPAVREHFYELRDQLGGWVERECYHGYEKEAEAHHGTEPFLLFLPRFLGLFPDDRSSRILLEDAAHHIGNWEERVPAWFDWEANRFIGYRIGTVDVENTEQTRVELAEHFRFIHIGLAAHRVTGEGRYLDWAVGYGRMRAQQICDVDGDRLPVMWNHDGRPVFQDALTQSQGGMAAGNHHVRGDPLVGVEVLLASGAIYALGDLYRETGEAVFAAAAKRIAEPMVNELLDPYSDPGAAALLYYRWTFGDTSLDMRIETQVRAMPDEENGEWAMMFPEHRRRIQPGVGKRADMTFWGVWDEDGSAQPTREPSTSALVLAYHLTGDEEYASRAFMQAERKLTIARRVLRGGREHADMGGAICSVAAGHGRNWGWGAVTGCYGPLMLGTREIAGAVSPTLKVESYGQMRLPDDILTLVRPDCHGEAEVVVYNGGTNTHTLTVHGETARSIEVGAGEQAALRVAE